MIKSKNLGAVREREREPQFSKINRYENKGIEFDFICDRLKDRIKL